MSTLNLPEIINISKAEETKSKNFILHATKAQWKKAIQKAAIYKGKKNFAENAKNVISFTEIDGLNGGLITAYNIDKRGKKIDLFPEVIIDNNKSIIVFKPKGPGGTSNTCKKGVSSGRFICIGTCSEHNRQCKPIRNHDGTLAACLCIGPVTY